MHGATDEIAPRIVGVLDELIAGRIHDTDDVALRVLAIEEATRYATVVVAGQVSVGKAYGRTACIVGIGDDFLVLDIFANQKVAIPNILSDTTVAPLLACASALGIVGIGIGTDIR